MSEWQEGCLSGHLDGPTTRVGSHWTTVRKIGGREREVTIEVDFTGNMERLKQRLEAGG